MTPEKTWDIYRGVRIIPDITHEVIVLTNLKGILDGLKKKTK